MGNILENFENVCQILKDFWERIFRKFGLILDGNFKEIIKNLWKIFEESYEDFYKSSDRIIFV